MVAKRRIAPYVLLLALAGLVQTVLVCRATVPSLDAVRFVHLAQGFDQLGLSVFGPSHEQPGFPLSLWSVHATLHAMLGPFRGDWALSAQLAAAIALVLAVIPVYGLSRRLVGPTAALVGTALFCLIPEVCQLGATGLSDSLHLLWFALAVWALVEYWSRRHGSRPVLGWTLLAGLATGLALLTRQEAVTLPVAFVVTLAVFQLLPARRQPWRRVLADLGCFALGMVAILGTYQAAARLAPHTSATASTTGPFVLESREQAEQAAAATAGWQLPDGKPMSFAAKDPTQSLRRRGYPAAIGRFVLSVGGAFGPWAALLAMAGLWHLRRRRPRDADRFVHVLLGVFSAAAIYFCAREGYLTPRHVLVWVVLGSGCAGYGVTELARRLAEWRHLPQAVGHRRWATATVLAIALLGCAVSLWKPVHAVRCGHRQAAEWLAQQEAGGVVLDTQGWTGLYSGCSTYLAAQAPQAWTDPRLAYVVLEPRELDYPSARSRTLRWLLETAGEPVATFGSSQAAVVVYRWIPQRLATSSVACVTTR